MSNVPKDTPTPAPTAIVFAVPGQIFASVAAVPTRKPVLPLDTAALNVTLSVLVAAWVGNPIAETVDDSAAVMLQQFVVVSACSRQQ